MATIVMKTAVYVNVISAVQLCICTKNVYPRKNRGGGQNTACPPLQKVGGHVPLPTYRSMPMVLIKK